MGGPPACDGEQHPALDNFAICRIVIGGEVWVSAEQYYQASKFADPSYREAIRAVKPRRNMGPRVCASVHGRQIWQMGQSQLFKKAEGFRKLQAMYVANRVKFEQNPECRQKLLQTHGSIQAAASTGDWQLWNSRILERIREELRPPAERDESKLEALKEQFASADDFDEASAEEEVEAARLAFGTDQRRVVAHFMDGRSINLYLHPEDSVLVLKEQLALQFGVSAPRLKVMLDTSILEDTASIDESRLQDGTEVTIFVASPVPQDAQIVKAQLHDLLADAGLLRQVPA